MSAALPVSENLIERTLEGLKDERSACVARLKQVLAAVGYEQEVEAYLRRIDNINAALIRLAATRFVR